MQHDGVCRCQVFRHDDVTGDLHRVLAAFSLQYGHDAVDHVIEIVLARAQVGVLHVLEHAQQLVAAQLQGPFRGAALVAYGLGGGFGYGLVLQHEQVGVDKLQNVRRRVRRYFLADFR